MRRADLDELGHVGHAVYVDYLQEARVDMMRTHAPDSRSEELAEGVVVVRSEVAYRAPLTFRPQPVSIECWVDELRAASFTLGYEVFDEYADGGRTTYLEASTVLAPYVFAAERPRRLTGDEREALLPFVDPHPAPATARTATTEAVSARPTHHPLLVRFSDVDVYGHVNNVQYFEYYQEGTIGLLDELVGNAPGPRTEVVVAQADVDYRLPILLRSEPYSMWSRVVGLGVTSLQIESEISDGDTVLSAARTTLVFWDRAAGRRTEPSSVERELLAGR